jgi:CRP/FNR family transcriptional regulator, cyclic AMP receptor protein
VLPVCPIDWNFVRSVLDRRILFLHVELLKRRKFDAKVFLNSPEVGGKVVEYRPATTIYSQGDRSDTVLYIQQGSVKLSVLSPSGKEAVVGVLSAGDFFGEGALAGQPRRLATATALVVSRIRVVPKQQMIRLLHHQHSLSDRFIAHMLARNHRLEEDLIDQLFNASEKRLARTLLLLARYGKPDGPLRVLPKMSQEVLAKIIGTTRSRVNFFMNKFRKLGFIDYNGGLKVHDALLSIVLHDAPASDD